MELVIQRDKLESSTGRQNEEGKSRRGKRGGEKEEVLENETVRKEVSSGGVQTETS